MRCARFIIINFIMLLIFNIQIAHTLEVEDVELKAVRVLSSKSESIAKPKELADLEPDFSASSAQKIGLGLVGVLGTGVTFTLEVLGAAGAFWGASDVLSLRNDASNPHFKIAAIAIGGVALVRYVCVHSFNYQKYQDYLEGINKVGWFGKIVKALETPTPAVNIAVAEIFCFKTKPKNAHFNFDQEDIESDTAILLKCAAHSPSANCDDTCTNPQLRKRANGKNLYECQLTPLLDDEQSIQ